MNKATNAAESVEVFEANTLLKIFILESPAPQSKHSEAVGWLNKIHTGYKARIAQLEQELMAAKAPKDK